MANFTEMGNGMPNIFNFIPEAGKSGSGINDLAGLLALSKDGAFNKFSRNVALEFAVAATPGA